MLEGTADAKLHHAVQRVTDEVDGVERIVPDFGR